MQKLLLLSFMIGLSLKNYAQINLAKNINNMDKGNDKDSSLERAETGKGSSYFIAGIAVGNRLLSVHNKVVNSKETSAIATIFTPSITYQNKSGFNLAVGTSLLNDSARGFSANQYYLSIGYQLPSNDNVDFAAIYTHYYIVDKYDASSSPIQNDFFTSLMFKKTWLQPSIAFDYSNGNSYDVTTKGRLYDSVTNKLKSYAFIASLNHEFNWESVFKKNDGFTFTPALLLNLGTSNVTLLHKTNATNIARLVGKKGKLTKFENTGFAAESVGIDLSASYAMGKFSIEPDFYLDYYLPATTVSRFTNVFNISLSYKF